MRSTFILLLLLAVLSAAPQGRHERKERERMESAEAVEVPGGTRFTVPVPIERAFEAVLAGLKRRDYAVESADKELGRIATALTVSGGYTQTGSRIIVSFIKDSEAATTVRVTATVQKRKKLLQAEPWGAPKLDSDTTAKAADEVKALF